MSGTAGEHVAGSGPRGGAGQGAAEERRGHREGSAVLTELGAGSQAAQVLEGEGGGGRGCCFIRELLNYGTGVRGSKIMGSESVLLCPCPSAPILTPAPAPTPLLRRCGSTSVSPEAGERTAAGVMLALKDPNCAPILGEK